jgi:hypothetical protein
MRSPERSGVGGDGRSAGPEGPLPVELADGLQNVDSQVPPQERLRRDVHELVHGKDEPDPGISGNVVPVPVLELVGLVDLDVFEEVGSGAGHRSVQDIRQSVVQERLVERVRRTGSENRDGDRERQQPFHVLHRFPPCDVIRTYAPLAPEPGSVPFSPHRLGRNAAGRPVRPAGGPSGGVRSRRGAIKRWADSTSGRNLPLVRFTRRRPADSSCHIIDKAFRQ